MGAQRVVLVGLVILAAACCATPEKDFNRPLPPGAPALLEVQDLRDWPDLSEDWYVRNEIAPALDRSIE